MNTQPALFELPKQEAEPFKVLLQVTSPEGEQYNLAVEAYDVIFTEDTTPDGTTSRISVLFDRPQRRA